jgi:HTH-type transcriptional regulator, quorum sensing regulator NprR
LNFLRGKGQCALIGEKIRSIRLQKQLSQKQVADGICSKSMLSLIESNHALPSIELLTKLCKRLGISMSEIYADNDDDTDFTKRISYIEDLFLYQEYNRIVRELRLLLGKKHLITDPKKYVMCTSLLAKAYFYLGKFEPSLQFYEKSFEIAISNRLLEQQIVAHNGMAGVYYQLQKFEKSLHHWTCAYEMLDIVPIEPRTKIKILYNLSNQYSKTGDMTKTLHFAQEGLYLCNKSGIYECGGHLATMIGLVMLEDGNWDSAVKYLIKALRFYEFLNDDSSVIGTYLNLAKAAYSGNYVEDGRVLLDLARHMIDNNPDTELENEWNRLAHMYLDPSEENN